MKAAPFKIDGVYCRFIELNHGQIAIVDAEDYDRINVHKWFAEYRESCKTFYAKRSVYLPPIDGKERSKSIYMHREIMGFPATRLDHRNHNGVYNSKKNLRPCTASQNVCNRKGAASSTSSFKGVSRDRSRKSWIAQIKINGRNKHLGRFAEEKAAARRYDEAATEIHGEFAHLNFGKQENIA
jgi:hypothetical protein